MEKNKTTPLEMKMTGKDGKTEFHLYINGEKKVIKHAIKYLQSYLELIKKTQPQKEQKK